MTAGSSIDYDALTQDALRGVVRAVLTQIANSKAGLPGDHHFYIAFNTQAPGVVMSRRLKEKYPEEMMIVLQHRFWDLAVTEEAFEVKLSFDGIPERLYVPFDALKVFFDPSVRFTLQFGEAVPGDETQDGGAGRRRRPSDQAERADGKRPRQPKPRTRPMQVSEDHQSADIDATQASPPPASPPTVFSPRNVDPAGAKPAPVSAPQTEADKPGSGAKVFSLDQFRNKK